MLSGGFNTFSYILVVINTILKRQHFYSQSFVQTLKKCIHTCDVYGIRGDQQL